jgi:hypothetical protein
MSRSEYRIIRTRSSLEKGLVSLDRPLVDALLRRLRRRLRAAEVRDRWAAARGVLSRLDLLERRTGRLLLGVQLSELSEHLGDGWDVVRLEDLLDGYREHVELPTPMHAG